MNAPSTVFIGTSFNLTATFTNTSPNQPGYGPIIEIAVPVLGYNGVAPGTTPATAYSGVTISPSGAVTYLGQAVNYQLVTLDDTANGGLGVPDPYLVGTNGQPIYLKTTDTWLSGTYSNGNQILAIQLPFGSFTPTQPAATVNIAAYLTNYAQLGSNYIFVARGGFQFGNDPLNDPATDPSIVSTNVSTTTLQPVATLITLTKTYLGPENETATGPNFPRQYRLDVTIAPGQTLSNLMIVDVLPPQEQFTNMIATNLYGASFAGATLSNSPSVTQPGGTIAYNFHTVTGLTNAVAASLTYQFFVPRLDASSNAILPAATGTFQPLTNQAYAYGSWQPLDPRDSNLLATANAIITNSVVTNDIAPEHVLTAKSLAIQKTPTIVNPVDATAYVPGETVEYTLNFQVSDYFAFTNLVINDAYSDGQRIDASFTPVLTFSMHGVTYSNIFLSTNWGLVTLTNGVPNDNNSNGVPADAYATNYEGGQHLTFYISQELRARSWYSALLGGGVTAPLTNLFNNPVTPPGPLPFGGTAGTIRFRVVLQDTYAERYPIDNSTVVGNDHFNNTATFGGDVLNVTNLAISATNVVDNTAAAFNIGIGRLVKSIYAINGSTTFASPVNIHPGNTVTYRLLYTLPAGTAHGLVISDFLPLPVLFAAEMSTGAFSATISAAAPAAGQAKYGPAETVYGMVHRVPAIAAQTSSGNNTVLFNYGNINAADNPSNVPLTVDILFTTTASSQPFADALLIMNQARAMETNTFVSPDLSDAIIPFILNEPNLSMAKGIVAFEGTPLALPTATNGTVTFVAPNSGAPGFTVVGGNGNVWAAPQLAALAASSLLTNAVDAGDQVRFAVAALNSGRSDAFDVTLVEPIPPGFKTPASISAMSLSVFRGNGNPLALGTDYNATLVGTNLSIQMLSTIGRGFNTDNATPVTSGSNVVLAVFDLTLADLVTPGQTLTNTAALTRYAGATGATNFLASPLTGTVTVNTKVPSFSKSLVTTEINEPGTNGLSDVVIGELVTYSVTAAIPEGLTPGVVITDTMDPRLAFVNLAAMTLSSGGPGGLNVQNGTPVTTTANANGGTRNQVTFTLGDITNYDRNNSLADTVTITYRAVVLNVATNAAGTQLTNSASFAYTGGTNLLASAQPVTVMEPALSVQKLVSSPLPGSSGSFSLDGIEVQATEVEKDVGFEAFSVPVAERLLDQPLNAIVEPFDRTIGKPMHEKRQDMLQMALAGAGHFLDRV